METESPESQKAVNSIYEYAANLMVTQNNSPAQTKQALIAKGLDDASATVVVDNLEKQIKEAKKERANKDMLYGALWCIGGTVATMSNIGLIFWGAIVFGAIQFFRGLINSQS